MYSIKKQNTQQVSVFNVIHQKALNMYGPIAQSMWKRDENQLYSPPHAGLHPHALPVGGANAHVSRFSTRH